MSSYITPEEYTALTGKPVTEDTERLIRQASEQIDTLTFNRIIAAGFERLTPLQQDIVKAVCAGHAAFLTEYGELLDSPLSSYSVAGVSMSWDSAKTVNIGGVTMQEYWYSRLLQTGLCSRALR